MREQRSDWFAEEGSPTPLGAHRIEDEASYNFALYSRSAEYVRLLLFAELDLAIPTYEYEFDPIRNKTGRVWHCRLKDKAIRGARYYAFKVWGSGGQHDGNRFDSQKILFDPYAKCLCFPSGFRREGACGPGSNAGRAPLGLMPAEPKYDWRGDSPPRHTSDLVIYELHVGGFSRSSNSGVVEDRRGTFMGVVDKIPYLRELGVTAVELLPVFQQDPQEGSYWGYMPLSFFSPHHQFATAGKPFDALREFREMVAALHRAEIEVILDVVYNHTAEGDETGPTYSYRGIDNRSYYLLTPDARRYRNDTGTGNTLNCADPCVRKMILDSLRFWKKEMHVDGFRFDLASIFTRNSDGSINLDDPPVISEIGSDPDLQGIRLIAEAWDVATYQLGQSFPGVAWLQWNGRFRDNVRAFIKGEEGMVPHLMARLYGSCDLFPDDRQHSYRPFQSVNYVACHDGFCLYDLVAYHQKRNLANGHKNEDGCDENVSWNCGWEGDEGVSPEVLALRIRQAKNLICLTMLSSGTPMVLAGDEFLNTQRGNNNPYNQDNEITWLDWELLEKNRDFFRFFKGLIALRKEFSSISRSRFWREDVRWFGADGSVDLSNTSKALAYLLRGREYSCPDLYVMINGNDHELTFQVQAMGPWRKIVDTGLVAPDDYCELDEAPDAPLKAHTATGRSIAVLCRSI